MDKIWYRNPSKSEVIGGDEKTEWPRRTDKSRTLFFFLNNIHVSYYRKTVIQNLHVYLNASHYDLNYVLCELHMNLCFLKRFVG